MDASHRVACCQPTPTAARKRNQSSRSKTYDLIVSGLQSDASRWAPLLPFLVEAE
jgi:hypothetical protein